MLGGPEGMVLLVLVLVLFGGAQLPKLARNLGRAQKEFKDGLADATRTDPDATRERNHRACREGRARACGERSRRVVLKSRRVPDRESDSCWRRRFSRCTSMVG